MSEELSKQLKEGRLTNIAEKQTLLVGTFSQNISKEVCEDHLHELHSLCDTYGLEVVDTMVAPLRKIDAATFLGKGKIEEIREVCENKKCKIIIFDDEILPQQQRNLEKFFSRVVIDRTELILSVFAQRAETKEAKIQVQVAQYRYQLPRLKRLWTHLERQRVSGGSGGYLKGAGERQIEIDKRLVKEQIQRLQKELRLVQKTRDMQRKSRRRAKIPIFAIVGYTNAGKSTLFKALSQENVFIEDKLFATLDTTTRNIILPNKQKILVIDTVGFIRKIPTTLVAAFKSTLEEALQADVLLHVIDASSVDALEQAQETLKILQELGGKDMPIITIFNKIDSNYDKANLLKLKITHPKNICISAKTGENLPQVLDAMVLALASYRRHVRVKIPQEKYSLLSELMQEGKIIKKEYQGNDIILEMEIHARFKHKIEPFLI